MSEEKCATLEQKIHSLACGKWQGVELSNVEKIEIGKRLYVADGWRQSVTEERDNLANVVKELLDATKDHDLGKLKAISEDEKASRLHRLNIATYNAEKALRGLSEFGNTNDAAKKVAYRYTSIRHDGKSNYQSDYSGYDSIDNFHSDQERRGAVWAHLFEEKTGKLVASYKAEHNQTI